MLCLQLGTTGFGALGSGKSSYCGTKGESVGPDGGRSRTSENVSMSPLYKGDGRLINYGTVGVEQTKEFKLNFLGRP